ncbi:uncharacterized protein CcaverHIS019_0411910 [Cutaneotrichosporon cavernicola]|uniref:Uncharacterized protein n=1 Tax=Cutaneotrichosporon cavernicola TaxID=279322 RepID=A0AA48QWH8_9TREE|nr:uncharacterized protein CcaverHIS019_0411910 [Cutaneotrichosporon cavernicola]BEI92371.1 hypothetical protein CcaverHIS019_0411910 [Cutaneotrichosporon cavernicola]
MSTAPAPAATWMPTPPLLPMVDIEDPRCSSYPPPYTADPVRPEWDGAYSGIICTTYNTSYTYPCCEQLGGTARTWCGRVQCALNDRGIDDWGICINQLMAETGGQAVGLACDSPKLAKSGASKLGAGVGVAGLVALAMCVLQMA